MFPLALSPFNTNVYSVQTAQGEHVGNLKRVGAVWNEQALEKPRFLPAAGANGAATLPARSSADKLREHAQTAGHRTGMVALTGAPLVRQIPTRPAAKPDTLRSQTPT